MTGTGAPATAVVRLTLTPALWTRLAADSATLTALVARTDAELVSLAGELELAAPLGVRVEPAPDDVASPPLRVHVGERPLPYPTRLLWQAVGYATSVVAAWFDAPALAAAIDGLTVGELTETVALVCGGAVAEALLDRDCAESVLGGTQAPAEPVIDLFLHPGQLLSVIDDDPDGDGFVALRELVAGDFGIPLPAVRLRIDPALRENGYAFAVNGVRLTPRVGLAADQVFLAVSPDVLKEGGFLVSPALAPVTGLLAAVARRAQSAELAAAGYSAQRPYEYLLSDLGQVIREHASAFITDEGAERIFASIDDWLPALTTALRQHVPFATRGAVLRALADDQVPVRNVRRIAELCVRYGSAATTWDLAARVRAGLCATIGRRYTWGQGTAVVYLLDEQFTAALASLDPARATPADWPLQGQLCAAMQSEIAYLPPNVRVPTLLTSADARAAARRLLRGQFPTLGVISYAELPARVNVRPVARISTTVSSSSPAPASAPVAGPASAQR